MAVVILAFLVIFYRLGLRPLDGDEGVILELTKGSFKYLWQNYTLDAHPPLFHILTWASLHLFGISEISLRLVSALSGVGLVIAVWLLTKNFLSQKIAFFAALLTAFSPFLLYYNQETRMYSLLALFMTLAFWQWLEALKSGNKKALFSWIIFSLLAAATHHVGLAIFAFQLVYLFIKLKQKKDLVVPWLIGFILYLPILHQTIAQFSGRMAERTAVPITAKIAGILNAAYRMIPGRMFLGLDPSPKFYLHWLATNPLNFSYFALSAIIPFCLIIWGFYQLYHKQHQLFWPIIWMFLYSLVLALAFGEIGTHATRYLAFLAPLIFLIIAFGIGEINRKWLQAVLALAMVIIMLAGVQVYYKRDQHSVGPRQIAQFLAQNAQAGDAVVVRGAFLGGEKESLQYYLAQQTTPKLTIIDYYSDYHIGNLLELQSTKITDVIAKAKANSPKVWYYDFTYQNQTVNGIQHSLGKDKEDQEIIVWEI